ncbi:NADH-quinone oxidoreductase subunit NuoE [Allosaccharopolyspora coralli]|uniref:NADH-quinone oxidoreductase subunit NuoE n=1 Tax=Allosaccharopolyspora coralli TaxID=2665642 RepID=A0A5Q3QJK0_9PSEU|nr:NADH-quinone oxidoreductase subunit NuoE [Allosaccharopolyspora coralli]QGK71629.1 NADH-quinone oxidoreductase subunit NuoE [Allosaccharopolyspora coralli]
MTEQFDFTTTEHVVTPTSQEQAFSEATRAEAHAIVARYPESRSALLPMLHLVQSVEGYVSKVGIEFCAEQLALSVAEVSAVATFYTMYKRSPCGQHLVSVCTNTLCAALGGDEIYKKLGEHLGVGHDETAGEPGAEGSITFEHAECLAACDFGPVLQVNYEYYDNQTTESATELVKSLQRGEKPAPTRGAPLTDLRTVERQLAGFFDGDEPAANDGPSSATETLRGARLAQDEGWTAPAMPESAEFPPVPERK